MRIAFVVGGLFLALCPVHTGQAQQVAATSARGAGASEPWKGSSDLQLVVSVHDRMLWVVAGSDTLHAASVAVASGDVLEYGGHVWRFLPPEGKRSVRAKKIDPLWSPPDWHYAEVAREYGLRIKPMSPGGTALSDGRRLVVRDSLVGIVTSDDTTFAALPVDEHIIFDSTLFIPPVASRNRQIAGELGRYALDLGDGYLLHGTRDTASIGTASTHGCIRLADDDLEWLFEHVPVGTPVTIR